MRRDTRSPRRPSGRFVLRLDPELHARLRRAASEQGLSLNELCARRLAATPAVDGVPAELLTAVERAERTFGEELVAVAVYGSFARGELADGSDVDLLIVLEQRVELSRGLYRAWDEEPLTCQGRPVEVHFVHLPPPGELPGGVWPELALDGLVLLDRGLCLSTVLARTRHAIAEGRLARRVAHGQPYWIRTEECLAQP